MPAAASRVAAARQRRVPVPARGNGCRDGASVQPMAQLPTPPATRPATQRPAHRGRTLAAAIALVAGSLSTVAAEPLELELLEALPVQGLDSSQPSGLTCVDGEFYVVSDQHDHAICRLKRKDDHVTIEPYITFNAPWSGAWVRGLDFEGLAYRDGFFYIVSEATLRILRVHETGGGLAWVTPSVETAGLEAGLFGEHNARLEGLALPGPGHVVLAVERNPRGLIDITFDAAGEAHIAAHVFDATSVTPRKPRTPDFSDLFYDGEDLYALSRNAEAVLHIDYDESGLDELEAWSFTATVTDPQYRYQDDTYGKAEGLALDADRVYVILDNNGQARAADPTDTRPLLFVFRRP